MPKVIEQSAKIIQYYHPMEELVAQAARTCYQSHHKVEDLSPYDRLQEDKDLIRRLIKVGHESVIEHACFTARITTDRATTHELVRHRLCSFSQESTRYCTYTDPEKGGRGKGFTVIWPVAFGPMPEGGINRLDDCPSQEARIWYATICATESHYIELLKLGVQPQVARKILPQSLKAELVMTANVREWRHIFRLRISKAADPQIRHLVSMIYREAKRMWPVFFEDLKLEPLP